MNIDLMEGQGTKRGPVEKRRVGLWPYRSLGWLLGVVALSVATSLDRGVLEGASAPLAQTKPSSGLILINPDQQFQEIQGFGVNFTGPYFRDDQKPMFNRLIDDLGVTMFRVVPYLVYSNWEETNDNDDPNVMNWEYYNDRYSTPIFEATWNGLRYLNSRGIRPLVALMGPVPGWMTDDKVSPPRHTVDKGNLPPSQQGHLSPAMYDEFAEEVVLDCRQTGSLAATNDVVQLELPDEVIFTLVGKFKNP